MCVSERVGGRRGEGEGGRRRERGSGRERARERAKLGRAVTVYLAESFWWERARFPTPKLTDSCGKPSMST